MAEKKQRSPMPRRFRYAELYHAEPRMTEKGKLVTENVYVGAYLYPKHDEKTYHRAKTVSRLCGVVNILSLVLSLSVDGFFFYSGGTYVLLPLAASLLPAAYLLLGAFRLPREDRKVQKDTYRFAHTRLRASAIGELCLLGVLAALLLLSLCLPQKPIFTSLDILCALLVLLPALSCTAVLRRMGKLRYTEEHTLTL